MSNSNIQLQITEYIPELSHEWDSFIFRSVNGTFLHTRKFLDHQIGRFKEKSLLISRNAEVIGVILLAEIGENSVSSYPGLTHAGLIHSEKVTSLDIQNIFDLIFEYLIEQNYREIIYTPVPVIFHRQPSTFDQYYLWKKGAVVKCCQLNSVLLANGNEFKLGRKKNRKIAKKNGCLSNLTTDVKQFYSILTDVLVRRHGKLPVHSLSEIEQLMDAFPNEIFSINTMHKDKIVAGLIFFKINRTFHVQYMASNDEGLEIQALDSGIEELVSIAAKEGIDKISFGVSTTDGGLHLNEGLLAFKEGYGSSTDLIQTFSLALKS